VLTCAGPALLATFVVLLPFLGKPFTNDDVTFLLQAKHVMHDPLHPTAFDGVFDGHRVRLSRALVTGPVMAYLLLPSVALGGAEWAAHVVQLGLLVIAAMSTAGLTLRLGHSPQQAVVASLLVIASPAVLGMAATAMPDIAAMAFAVAGMERLVASRQECRPLSAVTAGVLLAVAVLSRPHVLLLIPCASVWSFIPELQGGCKPSARWSAFIPAVVALGLVAVVVYVTRDPFSGDTIASATLRRIQPVRLVFNLASFGLQWAVAFPLVVLWVVARWSKMEVPRTTLGFLFGALLAATGGFLERQEWWWWLPLLGAGIAWAVLVDIIGTAFDRRDPIEGVLGLCLLIAAAAAWYEQLPPKLLIPSAPAMAILVASRYRWTDASRLQQTFLVGTSIAGLGLGVLVIRADAGLAEIGRDGGRIVADVVKDRARDGVNVWADGAWGYQWYAMEAGAEPLARTAPFPRAGDLIVAGLRPKGLPGAPAMTLLYRRVYDSPGGRVHSEGAGFFNNRMGPWPWIWGCQEVGRIEVWRVDSFSRAPT
jgi:hypothetical protein